MVKSFNEVVRYVIEYARQEYDVESWLRTTNKITNAWKSLGDSRKLEIDNDGIDGKFAKEFVLAMYEGDGMFYPYDYGRYLDNVVSRKITPLDLINAWRAGWGCC